MIKDTESVKKRNGLMGIFPFRLDSSQLWSYFWKDCHSNIQFYCSFYWVTCFLNWGKKIFVIQFSYFFQKVKSNCCDISLFGGWATCSAVWIWIQFNFGYLSFLEFSRPSDWRQNCLLHFLQQISAGYYRDPHLSIDNFLTWMESHSSKKIYLVITKRFKVELIPFQLGESAMIERRSRQSQMVICQECDQRSHYNYVDTNSSIYYQKIMKFNINSTHCTFLKIIHHIFDLFIYQNFIFPIIYMIQNSPQKHHSSQITEQKNKFDQLLNCQICYCKVNKPTMCPHCSKLYCEDCISTSLKLKSECPNCRKNIKGQLTNCGRFLNQLSQIVSNLIEYGQQIQKCNEHGINLNYFCEDCRKPACCECKMFGQHQTHQFQSISLVYEEKYNRIRDMLSKLKANILEKEQDLSNIQNQLISIKATTEAQISEIDDYTQKYKTKIAMENNSQYQAADSFLKQIKQLDSLREIIVSRNQQAKKNHCYKQDDQLMDKIEKVLLKSKEMLGVGRNVSSLQEVIPHYRKYNFIIHSYGQKKQENKPICSESIEYEGSIWRLVVYLQGNANNYQYLSIFIELLKNPDSYNQYQYHVQLINPYDKKKNIVKQHQARFEIKECWGYGKFMKNEELQAGNFINKEKDSLEISFGVRLCYYHDLYKRRQGLIRNLDQKILSQDRQIQSLETIVSRGSATSIKTEPN